MVENANKQCVVLLDEFDKTDPQVWQGILNTFEKGEWQDVRTRKIVNCSKTGLFFKKFPFSKVQFSFQFLF